MFLLQKRLGKPRLDSNLPRHTGQGTLATKNPEAKASLETGLQQAKAKQFSPSPPDLDADQVSRRSPRRLTSRSCPVCGDML